MFDPTTTSSQFPTKYPTEFPAASSVTTTAPSSSPSEYPVVTAISTTKSPSATPPNDDLFTTSESTSSSSSPKIPAAVIVIPSICIVLLIILFILYCQYRRRKVTKSQYKASINLEERLNHGQNLDNAILATKDGDGSDPNQDQDDIVLENGDLVNEYGIDAVPEYLSWDHNDIYEWIMSLRNGLFIGYQNELKQALKEENVNGSHLNSVDKGDIKGWGIIDYEHRKTLFNEIGRLVKSQQVEGGDTEFI